MILFIINAKYYKTIWRPYHLWLDYAWPYSWHKSKVYSAEDWVVVTAWWDTSWFGNLVKINWESWYTYYAHLSEITCKVWQKIKANEQIWVMWETGNSKWVHLHFGRKPSDAKYVDWNGRWNPTAFISNREIKEQPKPEYQNLIDDWIFNWDMTWLNEREMIIMSRIYARCKK